MTLKQEEARQPGIFCRLLAYCVYWIYYFLLQQTAFELSTKYHINIQA